MPIEAAAIRELRATSKGQILTAEDSEYDATRKLWNAIHDKHPAVIARCVTTEDVAAAVQFGKRSELEIAVRCGGHSLAGHSSTDGGLMIDLQPMSDVTVDADGRVARVGGGARIGQLDKATQRFGLATTMGMVSHTGVTGLTLGGGYGRLSRRFGLACDNLRRAEVVLGDGSVVIASEEHEPELFWGLRGGGGNFGVVTSMDFALHPVGPEVLVGEFTFSADDGASVLRVFRDLAFEHRDIVTGVYTGALARASSGIAESVVGLPVVSLHFVVTGPDLSMGETLVASVRGVATPLGETVRKLPYLSLQSAADEASAPGAARRYWKSSAFAELPDAVLDAFLERGMETAAATKDCGLEMVATFGGQVSAVGEDDTAFSHREMQVDFLSIGSWQEAAHDEELIALCRLNWETVAQFADAGVYVNNLGREDRVRESYGESKYRRLVRVKDRYDPDNTFHLNANILPSAAGSV